MVVTRHVINNNNDLFSRIGEGGFAFVYEAVDVETRSCSYALKRLLAVDKEKRAAIVQEISILKTLSSHNRYNSPILGAG